MLKARQQTPIVLGWFFLAPLPVAQSQCEPSFEKLYTFYTACEQSVKGYISLANSFPMSAKVPFLRRRFMPLCVVLTLQGLCAPHADEWTKMQQTLMEFQENQEMMASLS